MAEIRWTPQSFEDLESISQFIAKDSPQYAQLFVLDTIEAVGRLEKHPLLGRTVPEANNPIIRELILGNYRLVYRVRHDLVELLTIYHSARILDPSQLQQ